MCLTYRSIFSRTRIKKSFKSRILIAHEFFSVPFGRWELGIEILGYKQGDEKVKDCLPSIS